MRRAEVDRRAAWQTDSNAVGLPNQTLPAEAVRLAQFFQSSAGGWEAAEWRQHASMMLEARIDKAHNAQLVWLGSMGMQSSCVAADFVLRCSSIEQALPWVNYGTSNCNP